jgi:murein L,D-transpeptidase YafK
VTLRAAVLALAIAVIAAPAGATPLRVDRIVIDKSERTLRAYAGGEQVVAFDVALGRKPKRKLCEGDGRTPEGVYVVVGRNAKSAYHRALRLSYPSRADRARSRAKECAPGGDIMIHGLRNGFGWLGRHHTAANWTRGCIAVTNEEIEILWDVVPDGTTVEINA